jgi:hypothetical protein
MTTLYDLSRIPPETLEAKIIDGTITPQLQRAGVKSKVLPPRTTAQPDPPAGVKNAARIEAETREPKTKPQPDPLPVPAAEAELRAATDTVPTAPTDTSDDKTEPDEEEDLEPTSEETLTNAIEGVEFVLDRLFDEEIIYELAKVALDKRDAFFLWLRA